MADIDLNSKDQKQQIKNIVEGAALGFLVEPVRQKPLEIQVESRPPFYRSQDCIQAFQGSPLRSGNRVLQDRDNKRVNQILTGEPEQVKEPQNSREEKPQNQKIRTVNVEETIQEIIRKTYQDDFGESGDSRMNVFRGTRTGCREEFLRKLLGENKGFGEFLAYAMDDPAVRQRYAGEIGQYKLEDEIYDLSIGWGTARLLELMDSAQKHPTYRQKLIFNENTDEVKEQLCHFMRANRGFFKLIAAAMSDAEFYGKYRNRGSFRVSDNGLANPIYYLVMGRNPQFLNELLTAASKNQFYGQRLKESLGSETDPNKILRKILTDW